MRYGTQWQPKPGQIPANERVTTGHRKVGEAYRELGDRPGRVVCLATIERDEDGPPWEASRYCVVVRS